MKQVIKLKNLILFYIIISSPLLLKINAQISISISSGLMEHQVGIPNFETDVLKIIPLNITIKHLFEKSNFELGVSYSLFGTGIERHNAYKHPNNYSYWYTANNPLNIRLFGGIHSDPSKLIQTYGGIITGYWSYKMSFNSENHNNFNNINERIHQFALGPRFGLSMGKKVQLFIDAEYFWLTKTKYTYRNFEKVTSIQLGIRYNFDRKKTVANRVDGSAPN